MNLSIVTSIYNRAHLFERGLQTIASQIFPKEQMELVIIDAGSTDDLAAVYKPYIGQFTIRHITWDRTKHPIWQNLNKPGGKFATQADIDAYKKKFRIPEIWYHTPAIAYNIGIAQAEGHVIGLTQPEILHAPASFRTGYDKANNYRQVFSEIHWGTPQFNAWLADHDWQALTFEELYAQARELGAEYTPDHNPEWGQWEMYWYVEFFPKAAAMHINGVDLRYMYGVYGEDDQFRMRMEMAGCKSLWGGRKPNQDKVLSSCVGIHQSHADEKTKIFNQNREGSFWTVGANHNRAMFAEFCAGKSYTVANEHLDYNWTSQFCITDVKEHRI